MSQKATVAEFQLRYLTFPICAVKVDPEEDSPIWGNHIGCQASAALSGAHLDQNDAFDSTQQIDRDFQELIAETVVEPESPEHEDPVIARQVLRTCCISGCGSQGPFSVVQSLVMCILSGLVPLPVSVFKDSLAPPTDKSNSG